jgi:pimeloyl-ACP methyl ester carboxylesterase
VHDGPDLIAFGGRLVGVRDRHRRRGVRGVGRRPRPGGGDGVRQPGHDVGLDGLEHRDEQRRLVRELVVGLAATLPNSRLEVIDRARMFSMIEQPDALAGLIAGFAAEGGANRRAA